MAITPKDASIIAELLSDSITGQINIVRGDIFNLSEKVQNFSVENARTTTKLMHLEENLDQLNHILIEGNGKKPLITQVALLESEQVALKSKVDKHLTIMDTQAVENTKGKYTILAAAIPGIIALITIILKVIGVIP